jgi:hypothetical protein
MSDDPVRIISDTEEQRTLEVSVPSEHPMSSPQAFSMACEAIVGFCRNSMKIDDPAVLTLSMAVTIGIAQSLGITPRMLIATFQATVEGVATGNTSNLEKLMCAVTGANPEKGKVH